MNDTKQQDDGGPAFPFGQVSESTGQPINGYHNDGMSLRDWFAGMALQGLLACPLDAAGEDYPDKRDKLCRVAFEYADAMLAARKEEP